MIYEVCNELIATLASIASHYQQLLEGPATEKALSNLEETLEIVLPSDYRDFLRMHNGCRDSKLLIAFSLFSADAITSRTQEVRKDQEESDRIFAEGGWDSQKLLIGDSHVGWTLVMDCSSGTLFVYAQNNYALPLANSFTDYLVGLKDNLRDGKYQVISGEIFMDEWGQRC